MNNSICHFNKFFEATQPNEGTIAEMRDYEGWQ